MVALTLRTEGVSPKDAPLTNTEVDNNFIALNDEAARLDTSIPVIADHSSIVMSIALG
jgi:acyl dehydratase